VFEGGTAGLAALGYLEGYRRVVIVDALKTGASHGSVLRLAGNEIEADNEAFSLHKLALTIFWRQ